MMSKGKLIVISGPSGVGKGTICKEILKEAKNTFVSISATTREPRSEDKDGVTYFFKSVDEFKKMIENDELLEWNVYNENYYGTPKAAVEKRLSAGKNIILEIDPHGAINVKKSFPNGTYIFIAPKSIEILTERLKGRGSETPVEIEKRIDAAKWDLEQQHLYDYIVINDILSEAVDEVKNILTSDGTII